MTSATGARDASPGAAESDVLDAPATDVAATPSGSTWTPGPGLIRFTEGRLWRWMPWIVLLIGAIARLWNLGQPHAIVFDETYYVKDAWSLWHAGHELSWPSTGDADFTDGKPSPYDTGSFVVHPPLGKWIIGLGIMLFGPGDSFGWRITTALAGIAIIGLTMLITRALFRSRVITVLAGALIAIDGNAIVMSRVAILDNQVALFALLGAGAMLLDWFRTRRRLDAWVAKRRANDRELGWGPLLLWRPWLLAAGVAFGCCASVKWSGLYFLAFWGVWAVLSDALARRRVGILSWALSAVLKQGWAIGVQLVPIALVTLLVSWTGWFLTPGGWDRDWIQSGGERWTGALAWVPTSVQNWWHDQTEIYNFHVNEHRPHPYAANPLTWLFLVRPTSMYLHFFDDSVASRITEIANPLIWWGSTIALGFALYMLIRHRDWRFGWILTGVAAGYLPWLLYLDRTVFQFYTIAFEPYLIIGLAAALGAMLGRLRPERPMSTTLTAVAGAFVVLALALSIFWYPLWTATPSPVWFQQMHFWFPSWV